ncbi:unnamed protein product [Gordionus sp. m RMFG-2023]
MAENELHRNTRFINNTNVIFRSTTNFSNSSNDVKSEPYPHCKNTLDGVTQLIGCSKDERILFDLPSNSTMYAVDNENDHVDKCEIMSNIMESKSPENIDRIASGESNHHICEQPISIYTVHPFDPQNHSLPSDSIPIIPGDTSNDLYENNRNPLDFYYPHKSKLNPTIDAQMKVITNLNNNIKKDKLTNCLNSLTNGNELPFNVSLNKYDVNHKHIHNNRKYDDTKNNGHTKDNHVFKNSSNQCIDTKISNEQIIIDQIKSHANDANEGESHYSKTELLTNLNLNENAGQYLMKKLFIGFMMIANKRIDFALNEPLEKSLAKSLQKGEDQSFDQIMIQFGSLSEFCLPSLLQALTLWYEWALASCLGVQGLSAISSNLSHNPPQLIKGEDTSCDIPIASSTYSSPPSTNIGGSIISSNIISGLVGVAASLISTSNSLNITNNNNNTNNNSFSNNIGNNANAVTSSIISCDIFNNSSITSMTGSFISNNSNNCNASGNLNKNWYNNNNYNGITPRENSADFTVTGLHRSDQNSKDFLTERKELTIEYIYCLSLIQILPQFKLHPGHENLYKIIEDQIFKHFKYSCVSKDATNPITNNNASNVNNVNPNPGGNNNFISNNQSNNNPNLPNQNLIFDLYAEVLGVLAQSRFKCISLRIILELNKLKIKETALFNQNIASDSLINLLMGIKFLRIQMVPIEDLEEGFKFLQHLANYFLEIKNKEIKHALAAILVDILIPIASKIKNEVNIPCVKQFVDCLYQPAMDMISKKKHALAIFPLTTCLFCISQKQFFILNFQFFSNICLSNLKCKDPKLCRIALESLYRLLWVYMIRIRGESNSITLSRLSSIVNSLYPKGSKILIPKDAPLNIFVKIIQFISQQRLDFVFQEIILELLNAGKTIKMVCPERMSVGLRGFLVVADNLQQREGEPPMPQNLVSLPSGNTIRKKKTFVNKTLSEKMALELGISSEYFVPIIKSYESILNVLDNHMGKPYLMVNSQNYNKEADDVITGDRKLKMDLFRTCVAAIPRLFPEEKKNRMEIVEMLIRLTTHLDEKLRGLSFQAIQTLFNDYPNWRPFVLKKFITFIQTNITDSSTFLLEYSLRSILQLIYNFKNNLMIPQANDFKQKYRLTHKETTKRDIKVINTSEKLEILYDNEFKIALQMIEAFTLVIIAHNNLTLRRIGVTLLKEIKGIADTFNLDDNFIAIYDVMQKKLPLIVKRITPYFSDNQSILYLSKMEENSVDFVGLMDFIHNNAPVAFNNTPKNEIKTANTITNNNNSISNMNIVKIWICILNTVFDESKDPKISLPVRYECWNMLYSRLSYLFQYYDPNVILAESRASLLRSSVAKKSTFAVEREKYKSNWYTYLALACTILPSRLCHHHQKNGFSQYSNTKIDSGYQERIKNSHSFTLSPSSSPETVSYHNTNNNNNLNANQGVVCSSSSNSEKGFLNTSSKMINVFSSSSSSSPTHAPSSFISGKFIQPTNELFRIMIASINLDGVDIREPIFNALIHINPSALGDLVENLEVGLKESSESKQENVRRRKKRETLRSRLVLLLANLARASLFAHYPARFIFFPRLLSLLEDDYLSHQAYEKRKAATLMINFVETLVKSLTPGASTRSSAVTLAHNISTNAPPSVGIIALGIKEHENCRHGVIEGDKVCDKCSKYIDSFDNNDVYLTATDLADHSGDVSIEYCRFIYHLIINFELESRFELWSDKKQLTSQLFVFFNKMSGRLSHQKNSQEYKKLNKNGGFTNTEMIAFKTLCTVLTTAPITEIKALAENNTTFKWFENLMYCSSKEIIDITRRTLVNLVILNPDSCDLIDWLILKSYSASYEVAKNCFIIITEAFCYKELPTEIVPILTLTFTYFCSEDEDIKNNAKQLLYTLDRQFFKRTLGKGHSYSKKDKVPKQMINYVVSNCKTLPFYALLVSSDQMISYFRDTHQELTMPFFSEIIQKFTVANQSCQRLLLKSLTPWLRPLELTPLNFNFSDCHEVLDFSQQHQSKPYYFDESSTFEDKKRLLVTPRGLLTGRYHYKYDYYCNNYANRHEGNVSANGISDATLNHRWNYKMTSDTTLFLLNDLFYASCKYTSSTSCPEFNEVWAALLSLPCHLNSNLESYSPSPDMNNNLIITLDYLTTLCALMPLKCLHGAFDVARRVAWASGPRFADLVTGLLLDSSSRAGIPVNHNNDFKVTVERYACAPFLRRTINRNFVVERGYSDFCSAPLNNIRAEGNDFGRAPTLRKIPPALPPFQNHNDHMDENKGGEKKKEKLTKMNDYGFDYPFPMPAYGGYYAPLDNMLCEDDKSAYLYRVPKCLFGIILLNQTLTDLNDGYDWNTNFHRIVHFIILGTDDENPVIHQNCQELLLKLLIKISWAASFYKVSQILALTLSIYSPSVHHDLSFHKPFYEDVNRDGNAKSNNSPITSSSDEEYESNLYFKQKLSSVANSLGHDRNKGHSHKVFENGKDYTPKRSRASDYKRDTPTSPENDCYLILKATQPDIKKLLGHNYYPTKNESTKIEVRPKGFLGRSHTSLLSEAPTITPARLAELDQDIVENEQQRHILKNKNFDDDTKFIYREEESESESCYFDESTIDEVEYKNENCDEDHSVLQSPIIYSKYCNVTNYPNKMERSFAKRKCRLLIKLLKKKQYIEDSNPQNWNVRSQEFYVFIDCLCSFVNLIAPFLNLEEKWFKIALNFSLSNPSKHFVFRSLQVFRSIQNVNINSLILSDLMSRLGEITGEPAEDVGNYFMELILTIEICTARLLYQLFPDIRECGNKTNFQTINNEFRDKKLKSIKRRTFPFDLYDLEEVIPLKNIDKLIPNAPHLSHAPPSDFKKCHLINDAIDGTSHTYSSPQSALSFKRCKSSSDFFKRTNNNFVNVLSPSAPPLRVHQNKLPANKPVTPPDGAKIALVSRVYWLAVCLLESETEHEYVSGVRLLNLVFERLDYLAAEGRDGSVEKRRRLCQALEKLFFKLKWASFKGVYELVFKGFLLSSQFVTRSSSIITANNNEEMLNKPAVENWWLKLHINKLYEFGLEESLLRLLSSMLQFPFRVFAEIPSFCRATSYVGPTKTKNKRDIIDENRTFDLNEIETEAYKVLLILFLYLLEKYDNSRDDELTRNICRSITNYCSFFPGSESLRNLSVIVNLYEKKAFNKSCSHWIKCIINYLSEAFTNYNASLIQFSLELYDKGPHRWQENILQIIYILISINDITKIGDEELNEKLTSLLNKNINSVMIHNIVKLIVKKCSSLDIPKNKGRSKLADYSTTTSFIEIDCLFPRQQLSGPTLDFTIEKDFIKTLKDPNKPVDNSTSNAIASRNSLSSNENDIKNVLVNNNSGDVINQYINITKRIQHESDFAKNKRNIASLFYSSSNQQHTISPTNSKTSNSLYKNGFSNTGSIFKPSPTNWSLFAWKKGPQTSQERLKDRMAKFLQAVGQNKGFTKSPSMIFGQNCELQRNQSYSSGDNTITPANSFSLKNAQSLSVVGNNSSGDTSSRDDISSTFTETFVGVFKDFDFLDIELEKLQDDETSVYDLDNFHWAGLIRHQSMLSHTSSSYSLSKFSLSTYSSSMSALNSINFDKTFEKKLPSCTLKFSPLPLTTAATNVTSEKRLSIGDNMMSSLQDTNINKGISIQNVVTNQVTNSMEGADNNQHANEPLFKRMGKSLSKSVSCVLLQVTPNVLRMAKGGIKCDDDAEVSILSIKNLQQSWDEALDNTQKNIREYEDEVGNMIKENDYPLINSYHESAGLLFCARSSIKSKLEELDENDNVGNHESQLSHTVEHSSIQSVCSSISCSNVSIISCEDSEKSLSPVSSEESSNCSLNSSSSPLTLMSKSPKFYVDNHSHIYNESYDKVQIFGPIFDDRKSLVNQNYRNKTWIENEFSNEHNINMINVEHCWNKFFSRLDLAIYEADRDQVLNLSRLISNFLQYLPILYGYLKTDLTEMASLFAETHGCCTLKNESIDIIIPNTILYAIQNLTRYFYKLPVMYINETLIASTTMQSGELKNSLSNVLSNFQYCVIEIKEHYENFKDRKQIYIKFIKEYGSNNESTLIEMATLYTKTFFQTYLLASTYTDFFDLLKSFLSPDVKDLSNNSINMKQKLIKLKSENRRCNFITEKSNNLQFSTLPNITRHFKTSNDAENQIFNYLLNDQVAKAFKHLHVYRNCFKTPELEYLTKEDDNYAILHIYNKKLVQKNEKSAIVINPGIVDLNEMRRALNTIKFEIMHLKK